MSAPKTIAIIPARGGSKSIKKKNIKQLGKHPLVAYSILYAQAAKCFDHVLVSTDNEEIADVCRSYGANVPFIRPAEFAEDLTPDFPVFQHALQWMEREKDYRSDIVVHLRPTSPFRRMSDLKDGLDLLAANPKADSVRSITIPTQNPFKMWKIASSGFMEPLLGTVADGNYNRPRQELPKIYWQNASIDLIRTPTILKQLSMSGQNILPLFTHDLVDIDTPEDWNIAEAMLSAGEITPEKLGFSF